MAENFAAGHRGIRLPSPTVFTMTAARSEIAFCCASRREAEVVLMAPPDKRRAKKVVKQ